MSALENLINKVDAVLVPEGLTYHAGISEHSGEATWTRWDAETQKETVVSIDFNENEPEASSILVSSYNEEAERTAFSSFGVGTESVWPFFVNTLKVSVS